MASGPSSESPLIPKVIIHVLRGKSTANSREMKGRSLLIGSGPQCDIQMRSPEVGAKHALVTRGPEGVVIRQLDADKPLIVNGSPVSESTLSHGDTFAIGPFQLSIDVHSESDTRVSSATPLPKMTSGLTTWRAHRPEESDESIAPTTETTASLERLASIQRANAETEKELERRRRQIYDEMSTLETERARLKQERSRIDAQRIETERQLNEHARRETKIAQTEKEQDDRERSLREDQKQVESERLASVERSLDLDRQLERFESRKLRLLQVRRGLLRQYRRRREDCDRIVAEGKSHEARLNQERLNHEADVVHWRRVADELGRRQAELKRLEAELARRQEMLDRKENDLIARQTKFESEVAEIHAKQKSIENLKTDLDKRKARIAEEEGTLRAARQNVEEQLEKARVRSTEVQKKHEEVQARVLTLDRQEQYLREQAQALERQRLQLGDADRDLAQREAHLVERDSELFATQKQIESDQADLRVHELALVEMRDGIGRKEKQLRELAAEVVLDRKELDKRYAELNEYARTLFEKMDNERGEIETVKRRVEELRRTESRKHEQAEAARDQWILRMNEVREQSIDLAERESVLKARSHQLKTAAGLSPAPPASASAEAQAIPTPAFPAELRSDNHLLRVAASKTLLREAAETEELWAGELRRRRLELESLATELSSRQGQVHRQVEVHQKKLNKITSLASRLFVRPQAADHAEDLQKRQQREEKEIQRLVGQSQQRAEAVAQESAFILRQEQASRSFTEQVHAVSRTLDEAITDMRSVTQASKMNVVLDEITSLISNRRQARQVARAEFLKHKAQSFIPQTNSSSEASAIADNLAHPIDAIPAPKLVAPSPKPTAEASTMLPRDAKTKLPDADLLEMAHSLGLLSDARRQWHLQAKTTSVRGLREDLVLMGDLTPFQIDSLDHGQSASLQLGDAVVLELLHEGCVSTSYVVKQPGRDSKFVARMLKPTWSRDPSQRNQLELMVDRFKRVEHPNIVSIRGTLLAGDRFGVVSDYYPSLSLEMLVSHGIPPAMIVSFCHQAVAGILAAERAGFVHANLRPSRLLVGARGVLRIVGYAEPDWLGKIHRCEKGRAGKDFIAPEAASSLESPDTRADIYSLGVIFQQSAVAHANATSIMDESLAEDYSLDFRKLVHAMASHHPAERPTPAQAYNALDAIAASYPRHEWADLTLLIEDQQHDHRHAA